MKSILIVDDYLSIRLLVKSLLSELNIPLEVSMASNGKEALRLISSHRMDLIITDIFMPEMDGLELLSPFQNVNNRPKLIAMSDSNTVETNGSTAYLDCAREIGADYPISKNNLTISLAPCVKKCLLN